MSETKIWLDDERPAPDSDWTVTDDPLSVIGRLTLQGSHGYPKIEVISLDHDLGYKNGWERTGYEVLEWVEREVHLNGTRRIGGHLPTFLIHSANPVGRKRMQAAIDSIEKVSSRLAS